MVTKKKKVRAPPGSAAASDAAMNANLRRHYKEKARRQRLLEKHPRGFKDKFVSGCFIVGIIAVVIFVTSLAWGWIRLRWFE